MNKLVDCNINFFGIAGRTFYEDIAFLSIDLERQEYKVMKKIGRLNYTSKINGSMGVTKYRGLDLYVWI